MLTPHTTLGLTGALLVLAALLPAVAGLVLRHLWPDSDLFAPRLDGGQTPYQYVTRDWFHYIGRYVLFMGACLLLAGLFVYAQGGL